MSQPKNEQKQPYVEMASNNSPWTELFQSAQAKAAQSANRPAHRAQNTRTSEAESTRPTQDALSAIFNHS